MSKRGSRKGQLLAEQCPQHLRARPAPADTRFIYHVASSRCHFSGTRWHGSAQGAVQRHGSRRRALPSQQAGEKGKLCFPGGQAAESGGGCSSTRAVAASGLCAPACFTETGSGLAPKAPGVPWPPGGRGADFRRPPACLPLHRQRLQAGRTAQARRGSRGPRTAA